MQLVRACEHPRPALCFHFWSWQQQSPSCARLLHSTWHSLFHLEWMTWKHGVCGRRGVVLRCCEEGPWFG
eukprot:463062-Rhodomonas_salina.1